jgi:hypothetical protein
VLKINLIWEKYEHPKLIARVLVLGLPLGNLGEK